MFCTAGLAVYSATKHAIKGLTEALAVEFKAYGVRVADVLPGIVDSHVHINDPGRAHWEGFETATRAAAEHHPALSPRATRPCASR